MRKSLPSQRHYFAKHFAAGALFLCFLTGSLFFWVQQIAGLYRMTDVGYGDSYVLYDVLHFQRTGLVYRDLSEPPYLPAQYSPLVYRIYSFPARLASGNPFFGPRLIALGAFLLCVAVVVSIVRELIPVQGVWLWGALLATSVTCMAPWPLQLRGDFLGIFFSLLAVRLLLSRSRYAVLLAGLCSGLALQFKITLVASLIAGSLWLAARKRWRTLSIFLAAAALTSAGIYFLFWLREPRMIAQMLTFRVPIRDTLGDLRLFLRAVGEPVALLTLAALPAVRRRRGPRWMLLLLFVLTSLVFSVLADIHAGGNINYFFEALFAMTALAVWGAMRLCSRSRWNAGLALFLTGLSMVFWGRELAHSLISPRAVLAENHQFHEVETRLRGLHIFSTVPRMALLDPEPALMEPYLWSYLQRVGRFDPAPILERVRREEFDIVITSEAAGASATDSPDFWRGVPKVPPDLKRSISSAYKPYCAVLGNVLHLPRNRLADSILRTDWRQVGCVPQVSPGSGLQ
jgi:hypothetical protein